MDDHEPERNGRQPGRYLGYLVELAILSIIALGLVAFHVGQTLVGAVLVVVGLTLLVVDLGLV